MSGLTPDDLTPSQQPAYAAREPRVLILGGPGTGKTAVALLTARRILEEEPLGSSKRVLFLTFSRSATAELARRAPLVLAGDKGQRIEISTFHAFAVGMLNGFRRFAGGPLEAAKILTPWQEKLHIAPVGSVTFDALVPAALDLLRSAPWLAAEYRSRYVAVICDEYQDTSSSSANLLEELARSAQLICLADADQVIFDWTDDTITRRIQDFQASGAREYDLGYDSRRDPSNVIPRAAAAIRRRAFGDDSIAEACRGGRLRVLQHRAVDEPFGVLVAEIRSVLAEGAGEIGVFLATNRSVNEFAERLRDEDIEHEIMGLSGAAGEAQIAAAACARVAVGDDEWETFLVALGVFVASCYRGEPPILAVGLARDRDSLDPGILASLDRERDAIVQMNGAPFETFLNRVGSLWSRLFFGRPRQLWELGVRDLRGQTLGIRRRPLDQPLARSLSRIAEARRGFSLVDDIPGSGAPVRLMNVYQVKGREMDDVLLVHLPEDRDEWDRVGMLRLSRVHYVSITRARRRATFVLPSDPRPFFAPYSRLCG